uniref:Uncharacterized protein n=1 Tax=Ananas comosus var. bracteatus TaxID=296719 RepID=A0A6V7NGN8_ANACO|nr:unnamed protein product [Ananas comosus var. bracteatus]
MYYTRRRSKRTTKEDPPLNTFTTTSNKAPPTLPQQALLSQALTNTATLAKLLPSGTLLAFQLLTPVFTHNGVCDTATRSMTQALLALLAFSCILACFTDSFRSPDGRLFYGLATPHGMWLFDPSAITAADQIPDMCKYRLRAIDFVHAALSVAVFVCVALRDKNVVGCFYPQPERETQEVLDILPWGSESSAACSLWCFLQEGTELAIL